MSGSEVVARKARGALMGLGLLTACASPDPPAEDLPPLRTLLPAQDLDPDPGLVEIELVAASGVAELQPGVATSVFGYRDESIAGAAVTVPGPLIRVTAGERLRVHFRNELPSLSTTVHWHGLRLPPEMDGNPMVSGTVPPGESFEYDFAPRDPGLYWYHPHVDTDVQMEMGLTGPLLVDEPTPLRVDAERVFVLDDVSLLEDGAIDIEADHEDVALGRRGDVILVNGGAPGWVEGHPGAVERWRVVNSSNGRFFELAVDGVPLRVIGWDTGYVREPYEVEALPIAPGERYDLLVRLPEDEASVWLRSLAVERGHGGIDPAVDLVRVDLRGTPQITDEPLVGGEIEPMLDLTGAQTRSFELTSDVEASSTPTFFINGERWPLNTVLEVRSGDVDVWEVTNAGEGDHPFHVHGLFFEVLERGGEAIPRNGWKDTTSIPPQSSVKLAVPYGEPGMWMYHCQIPEHAERGMMGDLMVEQGP